MTAVGIDIGGTKLLAVRLEPGGGFTTDPKLAAPRSVDELVSDVLGAGRRLSGGAAPTSIGIGVPGLVDHTGTLVFAPNLQGATGAPIGDTLRTAEPGARVWVGNDATAAGWAEHRVGAGAGCRDMLMVTLGTGIGGGVVMDGRLVEGAHRFAGEFGHMVVDPNGPQCPCGKKGCWERFASGAGLGVLAREMAMAGVAPELTKRAGGDPEAVRGEHVTSAAADGEPAAVEIMRRFGWWVALGLANLANLFDPEVIVIGGGLVGAGDVLMQPIRLAFADLVEAADQREIALVRPAQLGPNAGAVGAALLAAGDADPPATAMPA
ncbi:MAG TPA: ROK family protein [Acidimicrobiales bacterium]|nr:ROK family protein [Acidimicrobiales bacterium]